MASPTSPHGVLDNLQQKITDDVECALCMKDCVNPKSLPCTHVFCLQCLEGLVTFTRSRDNSCDTIQCPTCRMGAKIPSESEGGAKGFPVGFLVNQMKEVRTALQTVQQPPSGSRICPSQCRARGVGLKRTTLGETTSVTLTMFDQGGIPCQEGLQLISLELISLVDGCRQVGKVKSEVGNQRVLTYDAVTKGEHQLRLKINGEDIRESPFTVVAYAALQFHGTFVSAIPGFSRPWGLSVSERGKLVVIDNTGWQGVHVYNKDGTKALKPFADSAAWSPLTPIWGVANGNCNEPRGVATDNDDNILVVDGKAHRIQLFRSNGSFVKSVGSLGDGDLEFNDPVGIAVNQETHEVYVCDRRNHRIQVLAANLSFRRTFGQLGSGPGDFYYPWDVDFDSHGDVYVADCGNYCIKVFTPEGRYIRSIGNGKFQYISSICIDKDDFVYAADKEKNCVSVFHPRGEFVMRFGRPGRGEGEMYYPLGVAVDKEGFVYVSDSYCQRVQVFQ